MPQNGNPSIQREYGVTGLDYTSGFVRADPDYKLQGARGVEQYNLMRYTDPTVAAVLMALSLPVRDATWQVRPASSAGPDVEAAEFVETCLHDMAFTWDDVLTEICTMFTFGWAYMEWVLKPRLGQSPKKGMVASQYDDGRIGFKKIALRGQDSLHRWEFNEESGELLGMHQWAETAILYIPISKAFLFRTSKELDNPEGFSVLRPAHRPWQYKRNIERVEAIGLQRSMQGLPVIKLMPGATQVGQADATGESTEERAQKIIRRLYDNTLFGVLEGEDMEFRFETPDMRGVARDSTLVIQRYDEAIARSCLAMYILLGSREQGSYALSRELGDLFFLAVDGFISNIAQTFSRWAIPLLFRYNTFPGITGYPTIVTSVNRRVDLEALATFINDTVGSRVIIPDDELERHVRELADFPAPTQLNPDRSLAPAPGTETETAPSEQEPEQEPEKEGGQERTKSSWKGRENFARQRGTIYDRETDAYQARLQDDYTEWVQQVDRMLQKANPDNQQDLREKYAALVAAGLLAMKKAGWRRITQAFQIGYQDDALSPAAREALEEELRANDGYLENNLWAKIGRAMSVQQLTEAARLHAGGKREEATAMVMALLLAIRPNVGQYSGAFWRAIWAGSIVRVEEWVPMEEVEAMPVRWENDPLAKHCQTCLIYGSRDYASLDDLLETTGGILPGQGTECDGNCRCRILSLSSGAWGLL